MSSATNAAEGGNDVDVDADAGAPVEIETVASASPLSGSVPRQLTAKDFPVGTIIDGKYQVESVLGQGGMGVVVAAKHLQLRERVALKFLRLEGDEGQDFRSRFRREAQIAAKARSEHVTRVIDVGTWNDAEYMVMEYLEGTDLRARIRSGVAIPLEMAIDWMVQVCSGLAEVHARGIVHRDLKPSNLFVVPKNDGTDLIKILDFGISKWATDPDESEEELTKTGAVLGSPKYMAPEQLFGSNTVDARADVWSIGAILYEIVTGKPPFDQPTFARLCAELAAGRPPKPPRELRPDLPEELDAAIRLCLEPKLEERIPNVASLAGELLAAVKDPFADPVRQRLQTTLDGGLNVTGTGPIASLRSGQYVAASLALSRTGSSPSMRREAIAAAAAGASNTPPPGEVGAQPESKKRGPMIAIAIVALAVLAFAVFRMMGGDKTETPAAAGSAAAATPSAVAPTPSTTTTAPPTATTAPEPTAASAAPTAPADANTAAATSEPVAAKPTWHPKKTTKTAEPPPPPPPPTVTAAPPPPPTVTAAPPPPPEPKKPVNPLEDRQ